MHFICPQQAEEALAAGLTTLVGGGTGPSTGRKGGGMDGVWFWWYLYVVGACVGGCSLLGAVMQGIGVKIRPKQHHRNQGHDLHAGAGADRADAAGHGQHPNEYRADRRVVCMFLGVDSLAVNLSISISVSISISISIGFMLCREGQQRQAGGARGDGRGGRHRYVPCIYMIHTHAHTHEINHMNRRFISRTHTYTP